MRFTRRAFFVVLLLAVSTATASSFVNSAGAATQTTTGPIATAVIFANFSDTTTPIDVNAVKTNFNGSPGHDVVSYFNEASYGRMQIVPSFFGAYTIPKTTSVECTSSSLSSDVMNAANADVDFTQYRRLILVVNCPNAKSTGSTEAPMSTPDGTVTAAKISLDPVSAKRLDTTVHEISHTLGSYNKHAGFYVCLPDAFDPPTRFDPSCTSAEYGDEFDVMGNGPAATLAAHLSPFHKANAGWFAAGEFPSVTSSASFVLAPYERTPSSGQPLALNIPRGTSGTSFTVEYRQPIGFDAWMGSSTSCPRCTATQGASIRLANFLATGTGGGSDTQLIDTTPGSIPSDGFYPVDDGHDGALLPGKTFTDPEYGISISVGTPTASGLPVQVTVPAQACTHSAPAVSAVSPSSQTATAVGQSKTYTFTATNRDTAGCAPQTFRWRSTDSQSLQVVAAPDLFTLAPGASTTVSLTVTSTPQATDGTYNDPSGAGQVIGNSLDANGTPVSLTYVLSTGTDTTAPSTATALTGQALGSNVVKLGWTASTDNVRVAGYQISTNTGGGGTSTSPSWLDVNATPGTSTTYTVRAFDSKNNLSPATQVTVTTPTRTDYTAPSMPMVSASANDHSITVSWPASTDNTGVAYYGVRPCLVPNCIVPAGTTSFTATGLSTMTRYDVQIIAYDGDGTYSAAGGGKLSVYTAAVGTTAPTQPQKFLSTAGVRGRFDLSWAPSTDDRGVARYDIYRNNRKLGSTTSTSYTDTTVDTNAQYYVQAVDTDGSLSPPSNNASFSITYTGSTDATAPTASITGPASGATVSGNVTVTASASDNVGIGSVDLFVDGNKLATATSAPYSFSWPAGGLSNGPHWIYALAHDTAGNYGTTGAVTVTVNNGSGGGPAPDTVPPSAPSNLSAAIGNSVDLSWTAATDNVSVAGYDIVRDGTTIGHSSTTTYSDETDVPGSTYTYQVFAVDSAGNRSPASNSATITVPNSTQPPPSGDSQAPSTPGTPTAKAVSASQLMVSWPASTDNVGVTGYDVYRNGALVGSTTSPRFEDSGLAAGGKYTYTVKAKDAAGNASAASRAASVTMPGSSTKGAIAGFVTNAADAPLANVKVSMTVAGAAKSFSTNNTGLFIASNLPPGAYTVTVAGTGYPTKTFTLTVTANLASLQDVVLGTP